MIDIRRSSHENGCPVNHLHQENFGNIRFANPAMPALVVVLRGGKRTYRFGPQEIT